MSTNQDLKNKFKIYEIIKNNFGLEEKSLKLFKYRLFQEPHIAPEYAKLLKNSDDPLRIRVDISKDINMLKTMDKGWEDFTYQFHTFIEQYDITYEDFRNNKVTINKQEIKLQKAVIAFYKKINKGIKKDPYSHYHDVGCIKLHFESIGTKKISVKKNIELVLSLNFADWFLCSTSESWGSCLNLESDYDNTYWSGLPGIIGDKNRAMLYLTDGVKKDYNGIKVDRILNRTWVLTVRPKVDDEHKEDRSKSAFIKVNEYPNKFGLDTLASNYWGMKWLNQIYTGKYVSNYYIEYLFHQGNNKKNGITSYIYQDNTYNKLAKKNKGKNSSRFGYLKSGGGGVSRWDIDGNAINEDPVYYTNGLTNLINTNRSLMDNNLCNNEYYCYHCEEGLDVSYTNYEGPNGDYYCESCYSDLFCECSDCDKTIEILGYDIYKIANGAHVCESCFNYNYFQCESCSENVHEDNKVCIENTDKEICKSCFIDKPEEYFKCDKCKGIFENNLNVKVINLQETNEHYCEPCYTREINKKQAKLNFNGTEDLQIASFINSNSFKESITFKELIKTHMSKNIPFYRNVT